MKVSEFGHAWSDDFIVLRDARHQFLTSTADGLPTKVANAVFCRHLIIAVVGSIEMILSTWQEHDRYDVLNAYFAKGVRNGDRLQSLVRAFQDKGFSVEPSLFQDFLALKYLRNTIEHSNWKSEEKELVKARNFPTNVNDFDLDDWSRIAEIHNALAIHLCQTAHSPANRERFSELARKFSE